MTRLNLHFVAAATILAITLAISGCGGYGTISPTAYEYAKALYSITNRQAVEPLEPVRGQIEDASRSGELSRQEARWLLDIVDTAASGEWKSANRRCRAMMEDQVQST
jgi:hypothetical protein